MWLVFDAWVFVYIWKQWSFTKLALQSLFGFAKGGQFKSLKSHTDWLTDCMLIELSMFSLSRLVKIEKYLKYSTDKQYLHFSRQYLFFFTLSNTPPAFKKTTPIFGTFRETGKIGKNTEEKEGFIWYYYHQMDNIKFNIMLWNKI